MAGMVSISGAAAGLPEEFLVMARRAWPFLGCTKRRKWSRHRQIIAHGRNVPAGQRGRPLGVAKISIEPVPSSTRKIKRVVVTPLVVEGVESTSTDDGILVERYRSAAGDTGLRRWCGL